MHQPEGSVAVLAASRTTMPYGMSVLGLELLQEFFNAQEKIAPKYGNPANDYSANSINGSSTNNRLTFGSLLRQAKQHALFPPKPTLSEPKKTVEKNFGQHRSIRKKVEIMAKTFDPVPKQLDDQIADHVAMFHLFGDPLLRLPVPEKIQLKCPAQVRSGKRLHLEGSLSGSLSEQTGKVNIELVPAFNQLSMMVSSLRDEFRIDSKTRQSNNEEYFRSNHRTVLQCDTVLSNGSFSLDLPIPPTLRGEYKIRAFYVSKQKFAIGCAAISVSGSLSKPQQ
jgi:hypothetical protein